MQASALITSINAITNDTGNVTYPESQVIDTINDAQRLICGVRPDACSTTIAIPLTSGSKQTIPITARRLLKLVRNMGADGLTSGSAIRLVGDVDKLDSYDSDWHNATGTSVSQYVFDEARPEEFYIYPTVSTPYYVEAKMAIRPTDIAVSGDSISIDDIYAPQIISWSVYRLLSRDSDNSPNYARAMESKQTVFDTLGIKSQSDTSLSPNARS